MRKVTIVFLIFGIGILALLALLHSIATNTPYIVALDEIIFSGIASLWELISQPIIAGAIVVLLFIRKILPSSSGFLSLVDELTASIGPFSLKGKMDSSRLFSQVEADQEQHSVEDLPKSHEITEVISRIDPTITKILVEIANKEMSEEDILSIFSQRRWDIGKKHNKTLVTGYTAGIIQSFDGILFDYSSNDVGDETRVLVSIESSILELLYDRIKEIEIERAPASA